MSGHAALRGDFHVHSVFSDDAVSTLAQNIAAASAAGLEVVRLTDHVRESTAWVPEFVAAVRAESIPDGLTVLTGVEAKLLDTAGHIDAPRDLAGVDAVVIADHQFPGPDGPWSPTVTRERLATGLTAADAMGMFMAASEAVMRQAVEAYPQQRAQLAHWFSILPKVGLSEDTITDEQLRSWAATAASTGTILEVNEKWGCPGPRVVRAALDAGVEVVASTDAHEATDVGRYRRVSSILTEAAS